MMDTMSKRRDPFIVVVKHYVVSDRRGRKYTERMLQDGFEIVSQTKTALSRATTVTFRKPNPDYQP